MRRADKLEQMVPGAIQVAALGVESAEVYSRDMETNPYKSPKLEPTNAAPRKRWSGKLGFGLSLVAVLGLVIAGPFGKTASILGCSLAFLCIPSAIISLIEVIVITLAGSRGSSKGWPLAGFWISAIVFPFLGSLSLGLRGLLAE